VQLSAAQRKFVVGDLIVGPAIVNFLLNYGIAWVLFRSKGSVPLWGQDSIGGDSLITAVILTWLTALIVTRTTSAAIGKGKFSALSLAQAASWVRAMSARNAWIRGVSLGLAAAIVIALPTIILLPQLGVSQLAAADFLYFKACFAAVLAMIVTPIIGWVAMHR
jgi:hypothetical protein